MVATKLETYARSSRFDGGKKYIRTICKKYRIPKELLILSSRRRWIIKIRKEAALSLRKLGYTLEEIGFLLRRDHSSISNLILGLKRKK